MLQERIVLRAPAKINLWLRVLGRRDDGYHLLETLMHKVGLYDEIELRPAAEGITLQCCGRDIPEDRSNLVYRAAELFFASMPEEQRQKCKGVALSLKKNIPVAAGLGGGSSDAAATLLGLNSLMQGCYPAEDLAAMGVQLGADVPFFLNPCPAAVATGIGEILQPVVPLAHCWILLVNPGFSVSTRWVYQTFALTADGESGSLENFQKDVARLKEADPPIAFVNDLERVTLGKFPELGHIKAEMLEQGAEGALMSGSGPTVFGLFCDQRKALAADRYFLRQYSGTFLVDPVKNE